MNIDELRFDERGLIPAIVQDAASGQVLTLAYMNRESLLITLREGRTCFWSRSRNTLWRKGETSGNVQKVKEIRPDCDADALLVLVEPAGPACHKGTTSCFTDVMFQDEEPQFTYEALYDLIRGRKETDTDGSYTSYLFRKGLDKILKKIGEEATEVIIAAKARDRKETVYEIADLLYHLTVLMVEADIPIGDVTRELASRRVVDKKVKQEKMT